VEHYIFQDNRLTEYLLQRYDLGYDYNVENTTTCTKIHVDGKLPPYWDWVKNATSIGRRVVDGVTLDVWEYKTGYSTLDLGVLAADPNHPVWLWRYNMERNSTIYFSQFVARVPSPFYFTVPEECMINPIDLDHESHRTFMNTSTKCETRANIISRAQVWVTNKVPYDQGRTYDGYREDCSGYVSMSWALSKPGLTTQTLPSVSKKITKADLLEGDVLLYTAEHVVLFGGWSNTAKTEYIAYEETNPNEGTVKRVTPYPYWYNTADFLPYRYNSVC